MNFLVTCASDDLEFEENIFNVEGNVSDLKIRIADKILDKFTYDDRILRSLLKCTPFHNSNGNDGLLPIKNEKLKNNPKNNENQFLLNNLKFYEKIYQNKKLINSSEKGIINDEQILSNNIIKDDNYFTLKNILAENMEENSINLQDFEVNKNSMENSMENLTENSMENFTKNLTKKELIRNIFIIHNGKKINEEMPLNLLTENKIIFMISRKLKNKFFKILSDKKEIFINFMGEKKNIENVDKIKIKKENEHENLKEKKIENLEENKKIEFDMEEKEKNISKNIKLEPDEVIVRNLLTKEKIIVKKNQLIKKNGKLLYLQKKQNLFSLNYLRYFFPNYFNFLSFDLIIKSSMIIALFYSGNTAMAAVILLICILTYFSKLTSDYWKKVKHEKFVFKLFDMIWSFFASMLILSYEVDQY